MVAISFTVSKMTFSRAGPDGMLILEADFAFLSSLEMNATFFSVYTAPKARVVDSCFNDRLSGFGFNTAAFPSPQALICDELPLFGLYLARFKAAL